MPTVHPTLTALVVSPMATLCVVGVRWRVGALEENSAVDPRPGVGGFKRVDKMQTSVRRSQVFLRSNTLWIILKQYVYVY